MWGPDATHVNITVTNSGTSKVTINSVLADGTPASDYSFLKGNATVDAGEAVTIVVSDFFGGNAKHQLAVVTAEGNKFMYITEAPREQL